MAPTPSRTSPSEIGHPPLTEFSHGAGCGCKLGPGELRDVLDRLAPMTHPDLLVGNDTGDDAAVWRLSDDRALVLTTDFFTPVVDDARAWGAIAASNAVSDVYAMGARPLLALNLVAFPRDALPPEVLVEVLEGAAEVARGAGFVIAGGHSIDDPEPKYGLAVVGEAHPDRLLTNRTLEAGHALVLTKPLGIGVVTTAIKRGDPSPRLVDDAIASMTRTNAEAADAAVEAGASAATDVTGFGLLGHLGRMATESGVDADLYVDRVPLLDGVRDLAAAGHVAGGTRRNLEWIEPRVVAEGIDDVDLVLLADAQTSGGLLFGAAERDAERAVDRLRTTGHAAAVIGQARPSSGGGPGRIHVM